MTLQQLLRAGTEILAQAGVPEAALDARLLLLKAFDLDEAHFLLERSRTIGDAAEESRGTEESRAEQALSEYRKMLLRRREREPLSYILGCREFMGLNFLVNRHVLIPRQDTETLVELVLREQTDRKKKVLDLCTGSGCIAVSLAVRGGYERVTAADLSEEALQTAEENARRLLGSAREGRVLPGTGTEEFGSGDSVSRDSFSAGRRFLLYRGDLFDALPPSERYDILVSNPPYIPSGEIAELQPEVRDYEPLMALDGAEDGLEFYRRIAAGAGRRLNPGGAVYLEIGCGQGEAVSRILEGSGFQDVEVFQDLPGLDRVVRARAGR